MLNSLLKIIHAARISKSKFLFLLLSLQSFSLIVAQSADNYSGYFSVENRLRFGNFLYNEKDYLRALEEFREVLLSKDNDTVRYKFADCFYNIGRFKEAADNFKGLFFNSDFEEESRLAFFKSLFFDRDFKEFRLTAVQGNYHTEKYSREIDRLYYISHLIDNSVLPDTSLFYKVFPDSDKTVIKEFYSRKKSPAYKSPVTAALLSGFLPGLGKIYTGEVSDGITSMIATGILTFLAIDNFKHKHNFRAWLFTSLATFSYAGTIYGSAASAQIYNAGVQFNFDSDVKFFFEKRNYYLPEKIFYE